MKNILNQKPDSSLRGRLLESVNFVNGIDLSGKKVLDIGCGYGWFEVDTLKKGVEKIVAMETSEGDLKTIKKAIRDERIDFKIGSGTNLLFDDKVFDTIVCWEVIEHLPKNGESKMFSEIYRVLKDDGVLYLSTPNSSILSNIFDPAWFFGHRHYTLKKLEKLSKKNFIITNAQVKGGLWNLLSVINMYIAKWVFQRQPFFKDFIEERVDREFQKNRGFVNLFIKFKKKKRL